ncbi:hypothetical protein PPMP20_15080 [Paraburkholderia phymatum]|nr:hypothetical protein [Paraburkholderia phymatum]
MTSTELTDLLDASAWFRAAPGALRAQLIGPGGTRRLSTRAWIW